VLASSFGAIARPAEGVVAAAAAGSGSACALIWSDAVVSRAASDAALTGAEALMTRSIAVLSWFRITSNEAPATIMSAAAARN
jgi:hypothetical protein